MVVGNEDLFKKKSAQLATNGQMPLKDLVLRGKETKVVLFCFAEEMNLLVSIKPAVRNVRKVQTRVNAEEL